VIRLNNKEDQDMPKPLKTLFVIADGARARWVRRSETANDFVTLKELAAGPRTQGHPQGASFDSHTGRPTNIEPRKDIARAQKAQFAAEIADVINADTATDGLDRLVVVAPARVQADIRQRLSGPASAKLAATLAKDLTKTPDHELMGWLSSLEN
jgi:protein required for attachment to host cells